MNEKQWDRLAENYHDEVISPFLGDVENPIQDELKKIKNKKSKSVAEFGCGLFYLGKKLSGYFKDVHASDFSKKMVEKAKKRNKQYKNINIIREDITNILYKNRFDIIISVNSLLMPSLNDIKLSLKNIRDALKKDGLCFLILPSMESILYHGMLLYHKDLKNKKEHIAKRTSKIKFENKKYDHFLGHYKDGSEIQKFYYKHEITYLMKKTGFKNIEIKKVLYPWGKDISDHEDFPKEDKLWDWFVKAEK
ncbi:MAG: methyltransferase domain-containing protein [Nanoarchaeota archaeon]|nr:methyltransferase domain-containing protein [Nanoarchaeota archaeon]